MRRLTRDAGTREFPSDARPRIEVLDARTLIQCIELNFAELIAGEPVRPFMNQRAEAQVVAVSRRCFALPKPARAMDGLTSGNPVKLAEQAEAVLCTYVCAVISALPRRACPQRRPE